MDVMEASIRAMSFTSLLHRAHWFEKPEQRDTQELGKCDLTAKFHQAQAAP